MLASVGKSRWRFRPSGRRPRFSPGASGKERVGAVSRKQIFTVASADPRGLLALLSDRLGLSLAAAQQAVVEGSVFVDGRRVNKTPPEVLPGQKVQVFVPDEPLVPKSPRIVFEDADLLVVDKPAGLLCQPGRRGGPSLLTLLPGPLWLPHRLDADTSGLTMLARSAAVCARLGQALAADRVTRTYAARACGLVPERGQVALRIGKAAGPAVVKMRTYPPQSTQGDPALTSFVRRAVSDSSQGADSLVWLRLSTGRTHQVRVHLAGIGHPIVGDSLYGGRQASRLLLHAVELSFSHPRTGQLVKLASPLPAEFWPLPVDDALPPHFG